MTIFEHTCAYVVLDLLSRAQHTHLPPFFWHLGFAKPCGLSILAAKPLVPSSGLCPVGHNSWGQEHKMAAIIPSAIKRQDPT